MTTPNDGAARANIDPEQMAKLLDGRLTGAEREQLLAQLEASSDAREALGEAAAVLAELEPGGSTPIATPAKVAPLRPWRSWLGRDLLIAAAAVLMIAVALPLAKRNRTVDTLPPVDRIATLLPGGDVAPDTWRARPWREFRGSGSPVSPRGRAVRIGAMIIELEVLAGRGDSAASGVASQIGALLNEYPGGSSAGDSYRALATARTISDPAVRAEVARIAETLVGAPALQLGAWLEAGRLAAARRDSAFFAPAATATALRVARSAAGDDTDARTAVTTLSAALAEPRRDWGRVSSALDAVLAALAN